MFQTNSMNFATSDNLIKNIIDKEKCPIELQIESGNSIVDSICGEPTVKGHAGLCEKHYKEYLIVTINKAKLETNSILTVYNYHELLRYQGIAIPQQLVSQKDDEYKTVCEKVYHKRTKTLTGIGKKIKNL